MGGPEASNDGRKRGGGGPTNQSRHRFLRALGAAAGVVLVGDPSLAETRSEALKPTELLKKIRAREKARKITNPEAEDSIGASEVPHEEAVQSQDWLIGKVESAYEKSEIEPAPLRLRETLEKFLRGWGSAYASSRAEAVYNKIADSPF